MKMLPQKICVHFKDRLIFFSSPSNLIDKKIKTVLQRSIEFMIFI